MRRVWVAGFLALTVVGCAEYGVSLQQVSSAPVPVQISELDVEIPAGILVTVAATGTKNGEALDAGTNIELESLDDRVLAIDPVDDTGAGFAFTAVAPGATEISVRVKGHEVPPISVLVGSQ